MFLAARNTHIHLNVLGWAGLTVLATLAAFGPALLRVRIAPKADTRAASLVWFLIAIAVDIVMVAPGSPGWSQEVAAMLLVGVLAPLVLTVLTYVGPMLPGRDHATRDRLNARVERLAR